MQSGYDPALVALSVAVSIFCSFTALSLAGRIRACEGRARAAWLAAGAIAMGGGIWSMHFIAMLAFEAGMPVQYEIGLTLGSLGLAIVFTGFGLGVVTAKGSRPLPLAMGGLGMGLGVTTMHYAGMAAMEMDAAISYDPTLFALSVAIAVVASTAALWLLLNLRSLKAKLVSAVVMAAAVCGMHYTGMAAARYTMVDHGAHAAQAGISPVPLAMGIAVATFIIGLLALASAIIDQRFAARASEEAARLRASEQRFRSLIQNAADAIALIDGRGIIRYKSDSAARILGYPAEQLIGQRLAALVHPEEAGAYEAFLAAVRETPWAPVTQEARLKTGSGAWGSFELVGTDLSADPNVGGIVVNIRDIATRLQNKLLEQKIAERTANLVEANTRLEAEIRARQQAAEGLRQALAAAESANRAKSAFLSTISHELRTPLNAIIGFSEMIRDELAGPLGSSLYGTYAADIHDSGMQLLGVVDNVLAVSRAEANEIKLHAAVVDPAALLRRCVAEVSKPAAERAITLRCDLPGTLPSVVADEAALTQVLRALLSNAVKFNRPQGEVAVAARPASGGLVISVADTGIGIKAEDLASAMRPFTQLDGSLTRRYDGLGLGLPVAKLIAEAHGGRLTIDSTPGVGTTATVVLPPERLQRRVLRDARPETETVAVTA